MRKDNSLLLVIIGLLIYGGLLITDKYITKLDSTLYISIALLGIFFVILGIIKDNKNKLKNKKRKIKR